MKFFYTMIVLVTSSNEKQKKQIMNNYWEQNTNDYIYPPILNNPKYGDQIN
jgi:hypothetical protein